MRDVLTKNVQYYALSNEQNRLVKKIFLDFPMLESHYLMEDVQDYVADELKKSESLTRSSGWIATVTKNYCIKLKTAIKQKEKAMKIFANLYQSESIDDYDSSDTALDYVLNTFTFEEQLAFARDTLTYVEFTILYLTHYPNTDKLTGNSKGLSTHEIATKLNMNENTVKSHLKRSRAKLYKVLSKIKRG